MATFCAASCEKENPPENNNGGNGNNSGYTSEMVVGTWRVVDLTFNGEPIQDFGEILLIMNEDGSGIFNDNGVTENNGFTWTLSGDQLTIVERHGEHHYTINSLTEDECTFTGDAIPGNDMTGNAVIHIVRVR